MIIFIYGPDTFRSREKLGQVIEQFQKKRDSSGMNVVRLQATAITFDRLRQEAMTQGFLSPKKMIVLEHLLEQNNEELFNQVLDFIKTFTKKEQDNVLVFWEGSYSPKKKSNADKAAGKLFAILKKQDFVFEFPKLTHAQLNAWVSQTIKQRGGQIEPQAARELAALVGNNLWQLTNDIDKLIAFKNNQTITVADVEQQVRGSFEANIFALSDAIAAQDKTRALNLLNQEIQAGSNEMYLLSMITRQFRILVQLQSQIAGNITPPDKIARTLKLHPFVVKKSLPAARKYTLDKLQKTYDHLVAVDQKFKFSHPNPKLLLELLIIN